MRFDRNFAMNLKHFESMVKATQKFAMSVCVTLSFVPRFAHGVFMQQHDVSSI